MSEVAGSGYEQSVKTLGDNLAAMLAGLWAQHVAGDLTRDAFADLAVILVRTANGQAASMARLTVAAYISRATGEPAPVITAKPPTYRTDPERIRSGMDTILDGPAAVAAGRLSRLGHAEPADAAAETISVAYDERPEVTGYTRVLESDPCDLCEWWASESHKFRPGAQMPRHPGCLCSQEPIIERNEA